MRSCVSDEVLLLCYLDEAPTSVRLHVATCRSCASRYRQFGQTLAHVERELQTGCPPHFSVSRKTFSHRWFPAGVALAAVLVLLWSTVVRQPHELLVHAPLYDLEVRQFFTEEIAPALSATNKRRVYPVPAPVSSAGYVSAALAGGWPCEQANSFAPPECEVAPFFFFFAD